MSVRCKMHYFAYSSSALHQQRNIYVSTVMDLTHLPSLPISVATLCLVYNITLTGFRLTTFELYDKKTAIGTTACVAMINAAVVALGGQDGNMKVIQAILAAGSFLVVNIDRIRNVVGRRYKNMNLSGKVYIVTGSNTGIGYETTKALLLQGATVVMACRSLGKANEARRALLAETGCAESKVVVLALDLCDLKVVRQFVEDFKQLRLPLHALINNAGLMMDKRELTADNMEMMFVANHLSHFLLTNLLLHELEKTGGRVVTLSSSVHNLATTYNFDDIHAAKGYEMFSQYGQTKLANILFTKELTRRLKAANSRVTAYAVHPGCVRTEVTRHMHIVMRVGNALFAPVLSSLQKTPEQGAYSSVHVATAPGIEHQAGSLFFHCQPIPVSAAAQDAAAAERLWRVSEELCGLRK